MRLPRILLASAAVLFTAASAAAGTLDFWEDSRGAQDQTAIFPTGVAQVAEIYFDADSAEAGGLIYGASEITIESRNSVSFTDFACELQGCHPDDYAWDAGRVAVSDTDPNEKHGIYHLGTITFDGPQEPGSMPLVNCNYIGLDLVERTCSPFVLVTLPEPAGIAALLAGAALLFGPLQRRRAR